MNILYKLLFMLSFTISLNALDFNQTQICQAFEDGIQTRTNNSKIKFINHSYLFNNLDNTLNGTEVINNNSNLSCRDVNNTTDENCQSSNILGYSLGTITRQSPQTFTLGLPVTTSTQKIKFKQNGGTASGTPLSAQEYKSVKSNWYPELNITFDITNILKVQHISTTDANNTTLRFKSADANLYDIEIKKLLLKKKTDASSDNLAQNIKIKTLQVNKKNSLLLQASTSISIENLDIDKNSTVTIKAPTVIINNLEALKKCTIKIVANKIDITNITLKNRADLTIESYDEDTHIDMRIDKLKLNKAFTLLNSGEYHIKRVELKNRSELSVGESVQIVNRRVVVLNHSLINASKDIPICDDTHNSNALFIYSDDLLRVENHSKIVGFVYINRRIELTNHSGIKGAISSKNRAILTNHSKVCYTSCNITPLSVDTTPPIITLNGENNITIIQGNEYSELGATAVDDVDGNVSVVISGDINSSTLGVYTIIYTAVDSMNNSANKIRTVNVIKAPDTTPPVITLNGDANITITKYNEYIELNATAIDDRDGNVFVSISGDVNSSREGVYTITYSATDSSGNSATKTRTVNVIEAPDTTPPVITLNGDAEITIIKGGVYNELGATAVDNIDENISVTISGSVDTTTVEIYTITYSATDSAGNEAILTREVNVVEPIVEYGVKVGKVEGQTATYYDVARFKLSLKSKPEADVTIPLSSSDVNEGKVISFDGESDKFIFTPDNWNQPQTVFVQGQNQNVVDGVQNYTIILDAIVSEDTNYDGINPDDVEMKGLILTLAQPIDTTNVIATLPKILCPKVTYNGSEDLNYTLSENPNGMTIDNETGCVLWEASLLEEGNTYRVTIDVTDGSQIQTVGFDIHVSHTEVLQSETNNNLVSITAQNTTLNGIKFRFLGNNPNIPTIRKVENQGLGTLPEGIQVLSDYFYADENNLDDVEVLIPVSMLSDIHDFPLLSLYYLAKHKIYTQPRWNETSMNLRVETVDNIDYGVLSIGSLKGVMFIGISPEIVGQNVPLQKKAFKNSKYRKLNSNPATITIDDINCTPKHYFSILDSILKNDYSRQTCTVDVDGLRDIVYTVKGFGNKNGKITHWNTDTTIEKMMVWIGESRSEFDKLGIGTVDRDIVIEFESDMDIGTSGYVDNYSYENGNIIHLTNRKSEKDMQSTVVHEYFHHAQRKTELDNGENIFDPYRSIRSWANNRKNVTWTIEGMAMWFEDYLYDDINRYTHFLDPFSPMFLTKEGLTTHESNQRYATSLIFKLFSEKCTTYEENIKYLFYPTTDIYDDPKRIKNLKNVLFFSECNFGSILGENKKSSLETALLYYQYAIEQENNMNLLDSIDDNVSFDFLEKRVLEKKYWKNIYIGYRKKILPYAVKTLKLQFKDIKDTNTTEIKLSIKTDKPLTIVGLHLDKNGKGLPSRVANGTLNSIAGDFSFTTEAGISKEYTLTDENAQGGLFITFLNATGEKVNILDINLTTHTTGIIVDENTSLMWQDTYNPNWALLVTYDGASQRCSIFEKLGGYTDWRVPTISELESLYNSGLVPHRYRYWSSDEVPNQEGVGYIYKMDLGYSWATWKNNKEHFRCVRDK